MGFIHSKATIEMKQRTTNGRHKPLNKVNNTTTTANKIRVFLERVLDR